MEIIGHIRTDFPEKFGIPRQSGLVGTVGKIVFLPPYRSPEAFRGIEEYSHLWLIFGFSANKDRGFSPTVRPPRLGGNKRMGVFATRSPFRPNPIGLSSVRLLSFDLTAQGPILTVEGADLLDGTPIYDVKPYLAYTDSHPDATGGFSDRVSGYALDVVLSEGVSLPDGEEEKILALLSQDPRPSYQDDAARVYYMRYRNYEIAFTVRDAMLTVLSVRKI